VYCEDQQLWLKTLLTGAMERRIRIGYNGSRYEMPELA